MNVRITLRPLGGSIEVERGTPLQEVLFPYGVEFPCGGNAVCEGCKVKVVEGNLRVSPEQGQILSASEIAAGWRLACQCAAEEDITLELAQWETEVLSDSTSFAFTPGEGFGIAVDLGTTTLAAQLLDLSTGNVLAVQTGLNQQARRGADVMSRVEFALRTEGRHELRDLIREQISGIIASLTKAVPDDKNVKEVVIVGNTVMHHLFSDIDIEPLSHYPFEPSDDGLQLFSPTDLGWQLPAAARVRFLPCLGGFVGSDILAGIIATGLHQSRAEAALIDLGTNGEIVLGGREGMLCCSTAAGPAFEGSKISMGMRASAGAIAQVKVESGRLHCRVLGNVQPRGICGSGLVDAVAAGLLTSQIDPTGRLKTPTGFSICPPVRLSQKDIRELQVAKAAIAAGFLILLDERAVQVETLSSLSLAGAFGNYVNRESARRIGLLRVPPDIVNPVGNTALLGAKLALFQRDDTVFSEIRRKCRHVSLHAHRMFQDVFVDEMNFPTPEPLS